MKSILLILLFITRFAFCQLPRSETGFVLTASVSNTDTLHRAVLINPESGKKDTTNVDKGRFTFKGRVDYPCFVIISVDQYDPFTIWLSNDTIQVHFDLLKQTTGTYGLQAQQIKGNQDAIDRLHHFKTLLPLYYQNKYQQIADTIRNYVSLHKNSFYSVNLIATYIGQLGPSAAKELLALISQTAKQSKEATYLAQRIQQAEVNILGKSINNFTLPDKNNKIQPLSTLVKPYTLIHFWASWCKPCREHNPELVALNRLAEKAQLQLISISVDESRPAWLNAVQKDGLSWPQLSDLRGFNSPVLKQFALVGIPYVLLIDQNYRILATTLVDAKRIILDK